MNPMNPMNSIEPHLVQRIKNQIDKLNEVLLYIHLDSNLDDFEIQVIETSKEVLKRTL